MQDLTGHVYSPYIPYTLYERHFMSICSHETLSRKSDHAVLSEQMQMKRQSSGVVWEGLRSIVRPSAHSGGKSWQKVGTGDFENVLAWLYQIFLHSNLSLTMGLEGHVYLQLIMGKKFQRLFLESVAWTLWIAIILGNPCIYTQVFQGTLKKFWETKATHAHVCKICIVLLEIVFLQIIPGNNFFFVLCAEWCPMEILKKHESLLWIWFIKNSAANGASTTGHGRREGNWGCIGEYRNCVFLHLKSLCLAPHQGSHCNSSL